MNVWPHSLTSLHIYKCWLAFTNIAGWVFSAQTAHRTAYVLFPSSHCLLLLHRCGGFRLWREEGEEEGERCGVCVWERGCRRHWTVCWWGRCKCANIRVSIWVRESLPSHTDVSALTLSPLTEHYCLPTAAEGATSTTWSWTLTSTLRSMCSGTTSVWWAWRPHPPTHFTSLTSWRVIVCTIMVSL